ncbi:glycosyltransferase [Virgibacillus profundi]|nr:glycosyltransferase [Virgibacillus profundi]
MLHELPEEDYDITVLLLEKKGGLYQELPQHVIVQEMKDFPHIGRQLSYNPKEKIKAHLSKRRYKQSLFLFVLHSYMKVTKDRRILFKNVFKKVPILEEKYDVAVAYAGPMDIITYYIANRVKAKEKYQWIHFDVKEIGFDHRFARRMYRLFNRIFVVSNTAANHLKEKLPTLSHKIDTQTNDIPALTITQLAEKEDVFPASSIIRIVTVARIMNEKGPDIAVKTLYELRKLGYNIQWHWVGEGQWISHIKEMIQEFELEDSFILEGSKSNPYPYIRQSDIYVQPSRHEGYCLTIAEARALKKPIVSTATAGAKEQIKHGETGLISEINEPELLRNIIKLIKNPDLRTKISEALQEENNKNSIPFHSKEWSAHYYSSSKKEALFNKMEKEKQCNKGSIYS